MQTQLTCPQCRTPFATQIVQAIDVGRVPQLKQMLLSGQLNMARCPNCGWVGQVGTPLVYHDPEHELFMVYVPSELGLPHMEEQQLIGQLTRAIVDNTPAEERRGYMLQPPMQMMRWQTFVEKVLETEGITREMLDAQERQMRLLEEMISADNDTLTQLITERGDEIDEGGIAMIRSSLENAMQSGEEAQLVKLTNLQARLMMETEAGRKVEKQQLAMHQLNQAAKEAGGLTPSILLEQLLANIDDDDLVNALVSAGNSALNYEFFSELSTVIEEHARQHDKATVKQLTALRSRLLTVYDEMREASEQVLRQSAETLQAILQAPDKRQALIENADQLDEAFTVVLSANIEQAEATENQAALAQLYEVRDLLQEMALEGIPPEIRLINDMIMAESEADARRLMAENDELVTPELSEALMQLTDNPNVGSDPALAERVKAIKGMIDARLALRI